MIDTTNYGKAVDIASTGLLNSGITRWEKLDKTKKGPEYVVSKIVCWNHDDEKRSPFLLDGFALTKGNVQMERERLEWAAGEGLGPILYTSATGNDCSLFAIQFFDTTLEQLNEEIEKRKYSVLEVAKLYEGILSSADFVSTRLNSKIARGHVIIDVKPENIAVDLHSKNIRILDWGAAQRGNKDCWGGIVYLNVYTVFVSYIETKYQGKEVPSVLDKLYNKVNVRMMQMLKNKDDKEIERCEKSEKFI